LRDSSVGRAEKSGVRFTLSQLKWHGNRYGVNENALLVNKVVRQIYIHWKSTMKVYVGVRILHVSHIMFGWLCLLFVLNPCSCFHGFFFIVTFFNLKRIISITNLIHKAMALTFTQITKMQKAYGFTETQNQINSGLCWKLEGSVGRNAMALLESGACMLPLVPRMDYYGSKVPPRNVLKPGTKGTFKNSQTFWQGVEDGLIEIDELAEVEDFE
jgi:hypothetical protein